jgi:hypothetical protein
MKRLAGLGLVIALLVAFALWQHGRTAEAAGGAAVAGHGVSAAEGGPAQPVSGPYRVLDPITSGNLELFPVVRADGKSTGETPFITLDEGLKSGEVEVTEAGRARGLVRSRDGGGWEGREHPRNDFDRGDQVNTLVLVNHSKHPLLLLAGEVVTGGKQDRIVAKDRIVAPESDAIDLSVFCIEPGRWTESSANFGLSNQSAAKSFMVQPIVRENAMAARDQQQVWDSVNGAVEKMRVAAAPEMAGSAASELNTTSYAKTMQNEAVIAKVDEAAAPVMNAREQVLAKLREEHAVGVVVAVRGEIVWADLFASTDLLARYWTKLVRSYAAESLAAGEDHAAPSVADAQHFLDAPQGGKETSEGEVGIYRVRDLKGNGAETFVLESLLPGANYDVHLSKMKLRGRPVGTSKSHPFYQNDVY